MDARDAVTQWQKWVVAGNGQQIDAVFAALDANLPLGWRRLTEVPPSYRSLARERSGFYKFETSPAHVGMTLSLERVNAGLRGGRVWFDGPPIENIDAAWNEVIQLLRNGIEPAAKAAGARFRLPPIHDIFLDELPSDVRYRLEEFSIAVRKELPLNREAAAKWRDVVVAAFRSKAIIDGDLFTNWLVATEWSDKDAKELNLRFFDQCLLLTRFAEELTVA